MHKGLLMIDRPLDKLLRILRLDIERSIDGEEARNENTISSVPSETMS